MGSTNSPWTPWIEPIANRFDDKRPELNRWKVLKKRTIHKAIGRKRRFRYHEIIGQFLDRERKIGDQNEIWISCFQHWSHFITDCILKYFQIVSFTWSFLELWLQIYGKLEKKNEDERQKIKKSELLSLLSKKLNGKMWIIPNGNMVAASLYEKALQAYMDLGNFPEKVQELKVKIQRGEWGCIEDRIETISAELRLHQER